MTVFVRESGPVVVIHLEECQTTMAPAEAIILAQQLMLAAQAAYSYILKNPPS